MENVSFLKRFDFRSMSVGYALFFAFNQSFDYILYPFMIYKRGLLWGGIIMALLSAAACLFTVLLYDLIKKDWLGIEAVKDIKKEIVNYGSRSNKEIHKITAWFLKKGRWAEFLFLSLKFDPFVTTAYLREGVRKFNGFKKEEWRIFIASVFVSNAWWTLLAFSGVEIFLKFFEKV